jgi:hypothetical protein
MVNLFKPSCFSSTLHHLLSSPIPTLLFSAISHTLASTRLPSPGPTPSKKVRSSACRVALALIDTPRPPPLSKLFVIPVKASKKSYTHLIDNECRSDSPDTIVADGELAEDTLKLTPSSLTHTSKNLRSVNTSDTVETIPCVKCKADWAIRTRSLIKSQLSLNT